MQASEYSTMAIKSYSYEAEALVKEYLLAESFVPYISVLGGIAMCKMVPPPPFLSSESTSI